MRVQTRTNTRIGKQDENTSSLPTDLKTIHAVYIIDSSGSMWGQKYSTALQGVKDDIKVLRGVPDVNYTLTVVEFYSDGLTTKITKHFFMKPIKEVLSNPFEGRGANGGTPLYQTVGNMIDELDAAMQQGDKVVINIFTDGEENASQGIYANHTTLRNRIAEVEKKGFTITYQGTQQDINRIVRELNIPVTNTLAHLNTAESIGATSKLRTSSMALYSKAVARGASVEELKENFYTKTLETENK